MAEDKACKCVELDNLPDVTRLFRDYYKEKPDAIDLFTHKPLAEESLHRQVKLLENRSYNRKELAKILADQNHGWGAGEATLANCQKLAKSNCYAVVTGQQTGFLGGPLYSLLKALHAVKLAEAYEGILGQPVVPIFWLELEDHDFAEVSKFTLKNRENELIQLSLDIKLPEYAAPVNRINLGDAFQSAIKQIFENIIQTEFTNTYKQLILESYSAESTLPDGFARLYTSLLSQYGLILADPSDSRLKKSLAGLFSREIEQPLAATRAFHQHAEKILGLRYHNQAHTSPERLSLYLRDGDEKLRIVKNNGMFFLNDPSEIISREELILVAENEPERLIPAVMLRPLVQDTLFPTLAYVGGPSEVAYFAQLKPAYEQHGIPMPIIFPRYGMTILGGSTKRNIKKYNIRTKEMFQPAANLLQYVLQEHVPDHAEQLFKWTRGEITSALRRMKNELDTGEGGFGVAVENAQQKIDYHMNKLQDRYLKELEKKHEVVMRQTQALSNTVFPGGKLQERVFPVMNYINRYGPDIIDTIYKNIKPLEPCHKILEV